MSEDTPVFLISLPRSGSSLLMRILDRGKDTVFGGETRDLLLRVHAMHAFREEFKLRCPISITPLKETKEKKLFQAFLLRGESEAWDESIRGVLKAWAGCQPTTRFWGWKEVHIGRYDEGIRALEWLMQLLPSIKFIYLQRDQNEVLRSMNERPKWWKDTHGEGAAMVKLVGQQRDKLHEFSAAHPEHVWTVDYEQLTDITFCPELEMNTGICVSEEDWQKETATILR
jgi:Sulfotransferase family